MAVVKKPNKTPRSGTPDLVAVLSPQELEHENDPVDLTPKSGLVAA
jgi:hypothetical protein